LTAEQLVDEPDICFLLVGHGAEKASLEAIVDEKN
jgi:hypothetical protein